jgi:hypothetical protein
MLAISGLESLTLSVAAETTTSNSDFCRQVIAKGRQRNLWLTRIAMTQDDQTGRLNRVIEIRAEFHQTIGNLMPDSRVTLG